MSNTPDRTNDLFDPLTLSITSYVVGLPWLLAGIWTNSWAAALTGVTLIGSSVLFWYAFTSVVVPMWQAKAARPMVMPDWDDDLTADDLMG